MKTDMTAEYFKDQKYVDYILGRTPVGRWGVPEDLNGAVVFLASPASNYVTGTSIVVDGGLIAK
jgi:2-dehydro-3-deoxy-D-gluconate 5-dehydrogenase